MGGWIGLRLVIEMSLERVDVLGPELPEWSEPGVELLQRHGANAVQATLRVDGGRDETGIAQYAQMFGDRGLRKLETMPEFADRVIGFRQKGED